MSSHQLAFDGLGEAELYHKAEGRGFFSVLWRDPVSQATRQDSRRVSDMPKVIQLLPKNRDTWLSQAEFMRPNRRLVNLSRLSLQFVDLDYYHTEWANKSRDVVVYSAIHALGDRGVPLPSLILDSGRGLQFKWLLDTAIPRAALPRWNAIQRYLVQSLTDFGADARAKDGSRVLRLVDTVNTKAGKFVSVAWTNESNGDLVHYSFEQLAELLPFTRDELAQAKADRAERIEKAAERRAHFTVIRGGHYGLRRLSDQQLAWDRVEDIRTLARLRGWSGGNPAGHRDEFVFWCTNFMALAGVDPGRLYLEASALAREFAPTWSTQEAQACVGTVVRKAKEAMQGQRVQFQGQDYSPIYTPRNSTLLDQFQVTSSEERQLKTIISKDEKRRRDRERDTERRRAAGAMERGTWLGPAEERRTAILRMAQEGRKQTEIAAELGITPARVSQVLKQSQAES